MDYRITEIRRQSTSITMNIQTILLPLSTLWTLCDTYSSGAPNSQCDSMFPGHNVNPQSGTSPFTISTGAITTYKPGDTIRLTVSGATFKGIILQARIPDGSDRTPKGTFSNLIGGNYKVIQCSAAADTVTHSSGQERTSLEATWTVPSDVPAQIQFVATVVVEYSTIWTNQLSATLQKDVAAPTESQTTQETVTQDATTESSDQETSSVTSDDQVTVTQAPGDGGGTGGGGNGSSQIAVSLFTLILTVLCSYVGITVRSS